MEETPEDLRACAIALAELEAISPPELIFAFFEPVNEARDIFCDAVKAMLRAKDHYHLKFYYRTDGMVPPTANFKHLIDVRPDHPGGLSVRGNLVFSFTRPLPALMKIGWRYGRGSKTGEPQDLLPNDFQLSAPNDERARYLAKIHGHFSMDPSVGLLQVAAKEGYQALYKDDGNWYEILPGRPHVLVKAVNELRFGNLDYKITYAGPKDVRDLDKFLRARKTFIEAATGKTFHPLPGGFKRFWPAIDEPLEERAGVWTGPESVAKGGFGWVTAGSDRRTGTKLAVKEFSCDSSDLKRSAIDEWNIGLQCQGLPGVLTPVRWQCEHRCRDGNDCARREFDSEFKIRIAYPLAYGALFDVGPQLLKEDRKAWYMVCRSSLKGLCHLHSLGYIHRDITPSNILIKSLDPPEGVIIDLGQMVQAPVCKQFRTPMFLRPPEEGMNFAITNKGDIFDWSRTMLFCFGYEDFNDRTNLPPIEEYQRVLGYVELLRREYRDLRLIDLLGRMVSLWPGDRPSAQEAFDDPCWEHDWKTLR